VKIKPFRWDVVIVGFWNRAILVPDGISKRLFKLPEGSGIEVLVPVNTLDPPQVKHDGIVVIVEEKRLIIGTENPNYTNLYKAMQAGCYALKDLPETPVFAAGYNVRFEIKDFPSEFDEITQSSLDDQLSDGGYEIVSRSFSRRIKINNDIFKKGHLNIIIRKNENSLMKIELNFHRDSNNINDLLEWLNIPEESLVKEVKQILNNISLNVEETKK